MKNSSKVVITYAVLLFAGALAMYIAEIYVGKTQDKDAFKTYTKQLTPFNVVVAQDNAKFRIEMSDSNSIDWKLPKEMSHKGEPAFVRNDTLFVERNPSGKSWHFIVRCKSLQSIVTNKGTYIRLIDPKLDHLTIQGKGGQVFFDLEQSKKDSRIGTLDLFAMNMERIEINTPMDCLNAQLDRVHLSTYSLIDEVKLKMVNNSSVKIYNDTMSKFYLENDSTCQIQIY